MTRRPTRRTALKAIGSGLALTAGAGTAAGSGRTPAVGSLGLEKQLRVVEEFTGRYAGENGIAAAVADGFRIMGPYVPDMGWHLVNFDRIGEAARNGIDITRPQGLTYNLRHQLGSVEYVVPLDDDPPNVFNDETADVKTSEADGWHPHHGAQHVYATPEPLTEDSGTADNLENASLGDRLDPAHWTELSDEHPVFPDEIDGLEVGDEITAPWPPNFEVETRIVDGLITHGDWWTLHVWVHFENSEGVFAPFNHSDAWDPLPAPPHH